jgi:DNA-binding FadR family transcriptional regulator
MGSEPELMATFGVSRPVIRQAVRLLDLHGAAAMQRGPRGGLVVRAPNAEYALRSVVEHLFEAGADWRQVRNLKRELLLRHLPEFRQGHLSMLEAALAAAAKAEPGDFWAYARQFMAEVCRGTANAVCIFIVAALRAFELENSADQPPARPDRDQAIKALDAMVVALRQHDHPLAQRALIQFANIEERYRAGRSDRAEK